MQDCYAGDIGDYGKFALLRELHGQGLCIGVNWYKTDAITSEKQEDGKYCIPDHLSVYDIMKRRTRVTSKSMESPSEVLHVYFFDYDRIELYDEENSLDEDRYDTIGDTSAGKLPVGSTVIGNAKPSNDQINDILFVVYTERDMLDEGGRKTEVTRLISARLATNFERGLYYGKFD